MTLHAASATLNAGFPTLNAAPATLNATSRACAQAIAPGGRLPCKLLVIAAGPRDRNGLRFRGADGLAVRVRPLPPTKRVIRPLYNHAMAKLLYKITFLNHGKVYELYGRHVAASSLWGFTEVGELVFDVHDGIVVDPTEERLREEFAGTRVLHLPMQSIVRIEEVERKGQSVIRDAESGERVVTPFPLPAKPR